jgi:hypothetical protein
MFFSEGVVFYSPIERTTRERERQCATEEREREREREREMCSMVCVDRVLP